MLGLTYQWSRKLSPVTAIVDHDPGNVPDVKIGSGLDFKIKSQLGGLALVFSCAAHFCDEHAHGCS